MQSEDQPIPPLGFHGFLDAYNLACHVEIAKRLRLDPTGVIGRALANLDRWLEVSGHDPEEDRLQREWRALLQTRDVDLIVLRMTDSGDAGQQLRQSTPMTGVLPAPDRDLLWEMCEARSRPSTC